MNERNVDPYEDGMWGDGGIEIVAEPLRYSRAPLLALLLILGIPALGLLLLNLWADGEADDYEASRNATSVIDAELVGGVAPALVDPDGAAGDRGGAEASREQAVGRLLNTAVLDFRRTPLAVSEASNADRLRREIRPVIESIGPTSCVSVAVDGFPVLGRNRDLPVIPASNQKLLVALAALDILGPDYTFTTTAAGPLLIDGEIEGDLFLIGGGDPLLTSDDFPIADDSQPVTSPTSLDLLADGLVVAGVTRIRGSVVGDGTRYDDEFVVDDWAQGVAFNDAGPYDALLVNDARLLGEFGRAEDPNAAAAAELVRLLELRDIQVDEGGGGSGDAPDQLAELAIVQSAPLSAVVVEMLLTSDNNTAEMLVKEMGVVAEGEGTRAAGLEAMSASLEAQGVPMNGVALHDGSGLSPSNRVTCSAMLTVLQLAQGGPIDAALPIAAFSGTLENEFRDGPMVGRLRAKTGTLNNAPIDVDPPAVKALAGYVDPIGGPGPGTIQFVVIANAADITSESVYRPLWQALGDRFATYPAGPSPDSLGPR